MQGFWGKSPIRCALIDRILHVNPYVVNTYFLISKPYLYSSLYATFPQIRKNTDIVQKDYIPEIFHLHGRLPLLPPESKENGIIKELYKFGQFRPQTYKHVIQELSKNLKIMYKDKNIEKKAKISQLINDAKNIFILGFGFDDYNFKNIDFFSNIKNNDISIYGTSIKLPQTIKDRFSSNLKKRITEIENLGKVGGKGIYNCNLDFYNIAELLSEKLPIK